MGSDIRIATTDVRPRWALMIAVSIGLLVAVAVWAGLRLGPVSPRVFEGWAQPNGDGTVIGLVDSPDDEWSDEAYVIAGADWRGVDGSWNSGKTSATCVGADTSALTHVRLGVVAVKVQDEGTKNQVVWLECLE